MLDVVGVQIEERNLFGYRKMGILRLKTGQYVVIFPSTEKVVTYFYVVFDEEGQ